MNVAIAFVLGLLVGWLIEYAVDLLYWRKRAAAAHEAAEQAKGELEFTRRDKDRNEERLLYLEKEAETLRRRLAQRTARPSDNLEQIKGVGPVIATLLNRAGIHTFADLASLTPHQLHDILGDAIQRLSNEEDIIEQARQLAYKQE